MLWNFPPFTRTDEDELDKSRLLGNVRNAIHVELFIIFVGCVFEVSKDKVTTSEATTLNMSDF